MVFQQQGHWQWSCPKTRRSKACFRVYVWKVLYLLVLDSFFNFPFLKRESWTWASVQTVTSPQFILLRLSSKAWGTAGSRPSPTLYFWVVFYFLAGSTSRIGRSAGAGQRHFLVILLWLLDFLFSLHPVQLTELEEEILTAWMNCWWQAK